METKHVKRAAILASMRTLNIVANSARAEGSKEITRLYAVKAGAVKKAMPIKKARYNSLQAIITVKGDPIPLIAFSPRQKKSKTKTKTGKQPYKEVSVIIRRDRGRKVIRGGFLAQMKFGQQIFTRLSKARGDVKARYTVGFPDMTRYEAREAMDRRAAEQMPKVLRHEMTQALKREAIRIKEKG